MYTIYTKRGSVFLLLMYSFRKVIKNFEGKVYVEKGTLRLEENLTIYVLSK